MKIPILSQILAAMFRRFKLTVAKLGIQAQRGSSVRRIRLSDKSAQSQQIFTSSLKGIWKPHFRR